MEQINDGVKTELIKVGQILLGKVAAIKKGYAEIQVGKLTCILPDGEVSFRSKEKLKKGEKVRVVVLQTTDNGIMVSLKRLIYSYHVGQEFILPVKDVVKFGAFFELAPHILGLLHISQIGGDRPDDAHEKYSCGDMVQLEITDINYNEGKISFRDLSL